MRAPQKRAADAAAHRCGNYVVSGEVGAGRAHGDQSAGTDRETRQVSNSVDQHDARPATQLPPTHARAHVPKAPPIKYLDIGLEFRPLLLKAAQLHLAPALNFEHASFGHGPCCEFASTIKKARGNRRGRRGPGDDRWSHTRATHAEKQQKAPARDRGVSFGSWDKRRTSGCLRLHACGKNNHHPTQPNQALQPQENITACMCNTPSTPLSTQAPTSLCV